MNYPVLYSTIQFYITLSSYIKHYPVLYSTIQFYTAQYSTIQYCPAQSSTVQHSPALSSIVQHCWAQYSTIQHCPALSSLVQHCPALSSTVQHCPAMWCLRISHSCLIQMFDLGLSWTWSAAPYSTSALLRKFRELWTKEPEERELIEKKNEQLRMKKVFFFFCPNDFFIMSIQEYRRQRFSTQKCSMLYEWTSAYS